MAHRIRRHVGGGRSRALMEVLAVVQHYSTVRNLKPNDQQHDLVEYLKSL